MSRHIADTLLAAWRKACERVTALVPHRSLIGEIMALQLAFAAVIGVLALTSFWWASSWIIRDYTENLSEQWLTNLDELGMPLYVSTDEEKFLRIENYVGNVSEMSFVRYYDVSGQPIFTEAPRQDMADIPPLAPETLAALATLNGTENQRYTTETDADGISLLRISKPDSSSATKMRYRQRSSGSSRSVLISVATELSWPRTF
jgi:hypothetical protein